jgi:predicted outer membrane repeat protein
MRKTKSSIRRSESSTDSSSRFFFERMEPRILLSADALSGLVSTDPFTDNDAARDEMNAAQSAGYLLAAYAANEAGSADETQAGVDQSGLLDTLQAAFDEPDTAGDGATANSLDTLGSMLDGSETENRQEIIIVDAATPDYQQLLDAIDTDTPATDYQIFILQSDRDGIEQITEILGGFDDIDALHLLSHGNETGVQLGSGWLDQASLDDYADALGSWSTALTEDADILIYGCNLAAGNSGQQLIGNLAELTGADVAASDDLTGAASLGGDWKLEYNYGDIETSMAVGSTAQQTWSHALATITVTTTADVLDGDADTSSLAALALAPGSDGLVSLREAIIAANTDTSQADTITLDAGTYTLSLGSAGENAALQGDLDILSDITISGADAATTIIDAGGIVGGDRVFDLISGGSLSMTNVTVQGGDADTGGNGSRGGGFYVETGSTLTLESVVVQNNSAAADGAGIYNKGLIKLSDVTISNNTAVLDGGGIHSVGATTSILDRVTLDGNLADSGGGIYNGGTLNLTNATLSGNTATVDGGGIYNAGTMNLQNNTITLNSAIVGVGGGIFANGTETLNNNIIAGNSAVASNEISGAIDTSGGYNIIGDDPGDSVGGSGYDASDILDTDPMLGVLADNGGFTQTHALQSGSIAIDNGAGGAAPITDQRGQIRIGSADVGAYEFTDYGLIWGDVGTDSISVATLDGNHVTEVITGLNDPTSVAIDPDTGKVYWANDGDGRIQRANLDGSGVEDIVTGLTGPIAIDLYLAGDKIYWTDASGNLSRANLDGSLQEVINGDPVAPTGVAVDGPGSMVYWVDDGSDSIGQTDLTGTPMADLVTSSVNNTADLSLDLINNQIYWTNMSTGQLWRANLDGSGVVSLNVGGTPFGLALDPVGNKTYWMDSGSGELYRVNLSDGSGRITLYSGLTDPRDVDFFTISGLIKPPPNDPPTATNLSSTSVYNEGDLNVAITDIVVSDADVGEVIKVSLSLNNPATGSLSANDGATYNAVTGVWTLTDTVANVNTALANLVFNPNTNNDVDTTISVSIDDGDEDTSGPLTGTITLDVTPVNDAPTATNLSSTSVYNEGDASVPITDIVVSDVDTGEVITATLTLADTSTGSLSANDGATYDGLTGIWTITDTVANVNTALANVVFNPGPTNDVRLMAALPWMSLQSTMPRQRPT